MFATRACLKSFEDFAVVDCDSLAHTQPDPLSRRHDYVCEVVVEVGWAGEIGKVAVGVGEVPVSALPTADEGEEEAVIVGRKRNAGGHVV